jgi:hypothetical protein
MAGRQAGRQRVHFQGGCRMGTPPTMGLLCQRLKVRMLHLRMRRAHPLAWCLAAEPKELLGLWGSRFQPTSSLPVQHAKQSRN